MQTVGMQSHDLSTDDTGCGGGDSGLFRVYEVSPWGKTLVYLSWPCAMTSRLALIFSSTEHTLAESRDYTAEIM